MAPQLGSARLQPRNNVVPGEPNAARPSATKVQLLVHAEGKRPASFTAALSALAPYEAATVKFRVPADLVSANSAPKVEITMGDETQNEALKVELPKLP